MTDRDSGSWLGAVLVDAQSAGWCTRPHCTTCGCFEFRRAYWAAAARQAGISGRFDSARRPQDILAGVSATDREAIVRTLVAGLRDLPLMWCDSKAFRTIIIDLDPPAILHGAWMALDSELCGTPAGDALAQMRAHAERVSAERMRREAYESPQAVEQRKHVKRKQRATAHALRQAETRRSNTERLETLAALARLSVAERLSRFAKDTSLKLDCVPAELIPAQLGDLIDIEMATAVALIARIGRRKGAWGRLRRIIEHRFKAEPE